MHKNSYIKNPFLINKTNFYLLNKKGGGGHNDLTASIKLEWRMNCSSVLCVSA